MGCNCNASSSFGGCPGNGSCGCGCNNCSPGSCSPCPPCDPAIPLTCEPLGVTGTPSAIVVEDNAYCKHTLATPASNAILIVNLSTGRIQWLNAPTTNAVFILNADTQQLEWNNGGHLGIPGTPVNTGTAETAILTLDNGFVKQWKPDYTQSPKQIPIAVQGSSTIVWSDVASLFPSGCGVAVINCTSPQSGEPILVSGTSGQFLQQSGNNFVFADAPYAPTGTVVTFTGLAAPAGFVVADGSLLSRTVYPTLWNFANTVSGNIVDDTTWTSSSYWGKYSYGDGSTTFRVPDLRAMFIRGYDGGRNVDPSRVFGSYQADMLAAHTHSISTFGTPGGGTQVGQSSSGSPESIETQSTGGTETVPKNVALLYCIKT